MHHNFNMVHHIWHLPLHKFNLWSKKVKTEKYTFGLTFESFFCYFLLIKGGAFWGKNLDWEWCKIYTLVILYSHVSNTKYPKIFELLYIYGT